MMTHDDHHQPINYNSTPPHFRHWDFSTTYQDYENFSAFTGIINTIYIYLFFFLEYIFTLNYSFIYVYILL
ncbi:hypothetical protein Hanom_Chr10g00903341 [Helianthus anomalus]